VASGFVLWLTGLPGAGKSTLANLAKERFSGNGHGVEVLDGDELRRNLSPELGFSKQDRELHAKRVAYLSKLLSKHGVIVIVALISPYRESRKYARDLIGQHFAEVYVKASPETCRRRDPKGLYKKAQEGKIANMTGMQDPYEPPLEPELILDTETNDAVRCVDELYNFLTKRVLLTESKQA
jgi:adenylylsulfate kinase